MELRLGACSSRNLELLETLERNPTRFFLTPGLPQLPLLSVEFRYISPSGCGTRYT